jgi:mannan endo-1,6-alpha-mannosidase
MWAEKTWDWVTSVGLMDADYNIYDGAHVEKNCTDINKAQFSYNNAVYLLGAAYMYNYVSIAALEMRETRANAGLDERQRRLEAADI